MEVKHIETSKYNYEHEKFKPILNEGCLIFSSVDDEKIHLFFKVQEVDGINIAELDFLKDSEWVGKYKFVFWPDTSIYDDYEYDMVECETAETLIYTEYLYFFPIKSPSKLILPDTQKRPNSSTINVR